MKARPIIFSGPMVRALLAGTKTQTRRVVRDMPAQPPADCHPNYTAKHPAPYFDASCGRRKTRGNPRGQGGWWCWWQVDDRQCLPTIRCPYGRPGDLLWVRESFGEERERRFEPLRGEREEVFPGDTFYRADDPRLPGMFWRPSVHMPRRLSRLTLRLTDVRVQRVQDISEEDARAEGITDGGCLSCGESEPCGCANPRPDARDAFAWLWNSINEKRGHGWHADPWVWALTFEMLAGNVDQHLVAA